jgi:hypothetical protein
MALYDKSEAVDLTPREKRHLKAAIGAELRAREAGRVLRAKNPRRS